MFWLIFLEDCMKMKKIGTPRGWHASLAPPPPPPISYEIYLDLSTVRTVQYHTKICKPCFIGVGICQCECTVNENGFRHFPISQLIEYMNLFLSLLLSMPHGRNFVRLQQIRYWVLLTVQQLVLRR